MSVLDCAELGDLGEAVSPMGRLIFENDLALILIIDLNYNNEDVSGQPLPNLIIEAMHSSTQQNLAVLRSRHRAQELSAVLAEKRSSTMLALTRQTIDDLIKQPPQHPHEMDTWFSRLAESFSRLTACEPPYPF